MGPYKVIEENKSSNHVISTFKRTKTTFRFVPGLKSIIEGFNDIVRYIIFKRLYFNVLGIWEGSFSGNIIRPISISNNTGRSSKLFCITKELESLWRASVRRQMEANHKPCFRINNKPNIILFAVNFNNSFISMPLIRVKINRIIKLRGNVLKQGSKHFSPGGNGYMRNLNTIISNQELRNLSCRSITEVKQIQGSNNNMQGGSHSFEVGFTKKVLTRSFPDSSSFNNRKSMITFFVTTAILGIVLIVMVYEGSLTALWVNGIFP